MVHFFTVQSVQRTRKGNQFKIIIFVKSKKKMKTQNTHFELTNDFVSESVWLAELQLCRSESWRDTGLNDDVKDTLYP